MPIQNQIESTVGLYNLASSTNKQQTKHDLEQQKHQKQNRKTENENVRQKKCMNNKNKQSTGRRIWIEGAGT